MFLHRFEQRSLRFRRRAVDFVRQNEAGKHRPAHETKLAAAIVAFLDDFRAGDVRRHEVRRELNTLELHVENLGDRADRECFRQSWHADHEDVALHGERDEEIADDFLLADDAFAEFGGKLPVAFRDFPQKLHVGLRDFGWRFDGCTHVLYSCFTANNAVLRPFCLCPPKRKNGQKSLPTANSLKNKTRRPLQVSVKFGIGFHFAAGALVSGGLISNGGAKTWPEAGSNKQACSVCAIFFTV